MVAPAKPGRKGPSAPLPKLNICGDIGLKIARDGTWYYRGSPIERKGLVKLFASVLRLEEDGAYYLQTPVEKVPITVEGLPFVAVEMRREGEGEAQALTFRTNVDDVVTAGPGHPLGFEAGGSGGLKARLTRAVYYELASLATERSGREATGVWSGGAFFAFPKGG